MDIERGRLECSLVRDYGKPLECSLFALIKGCDLPREGRQLSLYREQGICKTTSRVPLGFNEGALRNKPRRKLMCRRLAASVSAPETA